MSKQYTNEEEYNHLENILELSSKFEFLHALKLSIFTSGCVAYKISHKWIRRSGKNVYSSIVLTLK